MKNEEQRELFQGVQRPLISVSSQITAWDRDAKGGLELCTDVVGRCAELDTHLPEA